MNTEVWLELMSRFPEWTYVVAALLFLLFLVLLLFLPLLSIRNIFKTSGVEEKILVLSEHKSNLQADNETLNDICNQYATSVQNIRRLLKKLIHIRKMDTSDKTQEAKRLNDEIITSLVADIKTSRGNTHRCAFWMATADESELEFLIGSPGFPDSYPGNRKLDTNKTIGGRSFRKREPLNIPNVTDDHDWEHNSDSISEYKALICIPFSDLGIMTVDSLTPFDDETYNIIKLYAQILDASTYEMVDGAKYLSGPEQEVASTTEY
ncbi:GAF domain-containing protein [Salibacterium aidingense]|uniref:GAF domain-containing protein n=1 Tax=Salibacterium aidingense TaxID=384933 RepID=UPI0003F72FEB|nr:GAF domain-containing protein [Salibacterium aidingense]